ncbi:putative Sel1-like repeat-containing protein C1B3.10c [Fusarium oxysporum f. sp. albedinis]|nr:putative Sel1-like repeat-containing protein C1B3.10c [Fusarium oxysporum f. sp. albedinis]
MESRSIRAALPAFVLLFLLNLVELINDTTVSARNPHWRPGFWDAGTARVIVTQVSNISSAYILGSSLRTLSHHEAIGLNIGSILLATIATYASSCFLPTWTYLNAVVGPLAKFLGGGSHASKFLTLTVLHSRNTPCARTIYSYLTGFITVLAQVLGPILVTRLSRRSSHWSGLVAGILCLTAGGIAVFLDSTNYATQELSQDESGSVTDTLLSSRRYSHEGSSHPDDGVVSPVGLLKICLGLKAPPREKILAFTPWIFFFIAISQASRPLFATFAQQRCGLSSTEAGNLWLLRSEISLFIFGVLLPCLISMEAHTRLFSNNINLSIGRCSVTLMALGAIMISVSDSSLAITIGLIINTLGVSSNLSLLCFTANRLPSSAVGPVLMSFALSESVGSLVGIVIIYPTYQWSIDEKTPFYAGSLLYVFCGLNYTAIAAVIWRFFGKSYQQETED